jgi:transaldolase
MQLDQNRFQSLLAENKMASEKLDAGIKTFCADIEKLESLLLS